MRTKKCVNGGTLTTRWLPNKLHTDDDNIIAEVWTLIIVNP